MTDLKTFLRGLPAFSRFSERPLDALVSQAVLEQHPAGTVLIEQGQPGRALFIVLSGVIRVTGPADEPGAGDSSELRAGELFGHLSLLPAMPSPERFTVVDEAFVVALSRERYHTLFLLAPAVAHQLQYMLATQLAQCLARRNQALRQGLARRPAPSLLERLLGISDAARP